MSIYPPCLLNVERVLTRLKQNIWPGGWTGQTHLYMQTERATCRRDFISDLCCERWLMYLFFGVPKFIDSLKRRLSYFNP